MKLAVIDNAIKPKPTKSEITEALAVLYIEKCKKEKEQAKARREQLRPKIDSELRKIARKKPISDLACDLGWENGGNISGIEVTAKIKKEELPDSLLTILIEWHECRRIADGGIPCMAMAMKTVRESVSQEQTRSQRVSALLADVESRKVMEQVVAEI